MALLCIVAVAFNSCRRPESNDATVAGKYALYLRAKDGREYIQQTDDLANGDVRSLTECIPLDGTGVSRELIYLYGNYFQFDYGNHILKKFHLQRNEVKRLDEVAIPDLSLENFISVGEDSLLLIGLDTSYRHAVYAMVNTRRMELIKQGTLMLPRARRGENSMSIGLVRLQGDTLLVGYNYVNLDRESYTTSDTIWISALDYPAMTTLHVAGDPRSTYPGGLNTIQPYSFTDQKGDYYFISCPGVLLGHRDDLPTAIFRIRKGDFSTDPGYIVNVSETIGNDAYGMWSIGKGRVLVRAETKGSYTGWNDYHNVHQFSYYVLELENGSATRLDLPLDKGGRKDAVKVIENVAYISVNSTSEGNFIWKYDLGSGQLSKGLQLDDDVDYIFRIDVLN